MNQWEVFQGANCFTDFVFCSYVSSFTSILPVLGRISVSERVSTSREAMWQFPGPGKRSGSPAPLEF